MTDTLNCLSIALFSRSLLDADDSFLCECRPGFVGLTCEAEIDECATNACDPTGTAKCLDLDNKFECECREGFEGELCQTNVDDCAGSPCLNEGELAYYAINNWVV